MFDEENNRYLDCINNVAHGILYLVVFHAYFLCSNYTSVIYTHCLNLVLSHLVMYLAAYSVTV